MSETTKGGKSIPVLISGAGPTGLLLALWLQRFKVPFRIIDAAPQRDASTSRALIVHARTLEFYRMLGIADELMAEAVIMEDLVFLHNKKPSLRVQLGHGGRGLSKFDVVLSVGQDKHEVILERALDERARQGSDSGNGVVEYGTRIIDFTDMDGKDSITVRLSRQDGSEETVRATYIAGCDGAHSAVRHAAAQAGGIQMEGGTYQQRFFVADVETVPGKETTVSRKAPNIHLTRTEFSLAIPIRGENRYRLIGFTPDVPEDKLSTLSFEDVRPSLENTMDLETERVNWFSHYKVHHRVATHFRYGRLFVCGDAAHLHSPVGGQGMNTGLGDATNLAWKLATVYYRNKSGLNEAQDGTAAADDQLLDTYEEERIAFARTLVKTTDQIFQLITDGGFAGFMMRNLIFPYIFPLFVRFLNLAPQMFRRTSQILIQYRHSAISRYLTGPSSGSACAGDRLPWIEHAYIAPYTANGGNASSNQDGSNADNFAPLRAATWQVHTYSDRTIPSPVRSLLEKRGIEVHNFGWSDDSEHQASGLAQDTAYLIRPDGYIGATFALPVPGREFPTSDLKKLDEFCQKWGVGVIPH